MHQLVYFLIGLLFGLGLISSGMSNPAKVQGFLDLAGAWDPSLALVMAGAIGVGFFGFRYAKGQPTTWLGHPLQLPTARHLDGALLGGSALFGIGWGLAGICPGPSLVLLVTAPQAGLPFVGAMLVGMLLYKGYLRLRRPV